MSKLGIAAINSNQSRTHKFFLLANYILIGAATSCIFLTLSLRLIPSLVGFFTILLHITTIASSVLLCSSSSSSSTTSPKCHVANMASTVLIAILQGAVALLLFTRSLEFLNGLKSYVREDDGVVILRMIGSLGLVMFVFEWVVLVLDFVMRFYVYVAEEDNNAARVRDVEGEKDKDWPWPFQL